MPSEIDKALEEAFAKAVELDGDDREAFLAAFGSEHPALIERLRALIAADLSPSEMLASPISRSVETLALDEVDPWIGKVIGPYTISERIGAGGMGAVFLAERTDETYAQKVAIKIMATQLLSANAMSRFRTERQILASLNHPHIGKLLDGGSTDTGLPFLVMEFIDGQAIDLYCEAQELDIRHRVKLFQKVCAAVDYAHRNLVVHRDLKPSNILVNENDAPKLLDFGIAKLLDPDEYQLTVVQTGGGDRIMTPDYASPEQVRGEKISISTDIYALGVLLFRLLTGQSPYGDSTTPREIEDAILNDEPKSPSSVLSQQLKSKDTTSLSASARDESINVQNMLRRSLKGDLDNIVLKCMQKDPERRYSSARELSADLDRYLRHEPVVARGDDWAYIARKFIVRRARPLAVAASVTVAIIGLTTFYTIQLAKERNQALQAAVEAQQAATQSREISDFLESLFESASPVTAQGKEVTAVNLLNAGVERINQLSDQPAVQAELLGMMSSSYLSLGIPDISVRLQERAVGILEADQAIDPLQLAEGLAAMAEAKRLHGQLRDAETAMRRALAIRERELGPTDLLVAETVGRLGTILFDTRDHKEGLEFLNRAVAIKSAVTPEPDEDLLDMQGNLAITLDQLGRYDEAESLMRENVALSEQINGELFPNTIIRLANLSHLLARRAKHREAFSARMEALRRAEIVWPETHPTRASYYSFVASSYLTMGDFAKARDYAEQGVEMAAAGTGEQHFRYVARLRTLGGILIELGDFEAADAALEKALSIATSLSSEPTHQTQTALLYLGQSMNRQARYKDAEQKLRAAFQQSEKLGLSRKLQVQRELAVSLSHQGRNDEAEELFAEVIAAHEASEGPDNQILLPVLTRLAAHYRIKGALDDAEATALRAQNIGDKTLPPGHWHTAFATAEYAYILNEKGQSGRAKILAQRAHASLGDLLNPNDQRLTSLKALTQ